MNKHIDIIEQFENETELPATWSTGHLGGYTKEYTEWLQGKVATTDTSKTCDDQNDRSQNVSGLSLFEIIENYDKDFKLSKQLKHYVNEHIYKWDLNYHNYKGTFSEWLSDNDR